MSPKIRIFYGMSGTFKATTIKSAIRDYPHIIPIWSMIKPWKKYETEIFTGMVQRNNINFAILHLCILQHTINKNNVYYIERGVTDMAFYNRNIVKTDSDDWIKRAVSTEEYITGPAEKVLLIQKDKKFIENVILREKTRKEVFPGGVDDFLQAQNEYVEFTEKYNNISEVIEINNAKKYIIDLGLSYDESQK